MMDPATARMALKLQLDDVDAILKTLPTTSNDITATSEATAFRWLREELVRKWQELSGYYFAHNVLKEENGNLAAFKRLLNEEQQAERDHDMACRLAGKPVPQHAARPAKRNAHGEPEADQMNDATNAAAPGVKKPRFGISTTKNAAGVFGIPRTQKRAAEEQLTSEAKKKAATKSAMAGKQATVEDVADEEAPPRGTLEPGPSKPQKRAADVVPAILRERDDGRTKRPKSSAVEEVPLSLKYTTAPKPAQEWFKSAPQISRTTDVGKCSSCLDMHPRRDMLQLPCKGDGDSEYHAYCRDCVKGLFQSSVTDPSLFPPRCCNKIIPLFKCAPFLPQPLIARFMERHEELRTVDRTYCSKCTKWIQPDNIKAKVGTCADCREKTCTTCKGKQHEGLCPEDKGVKQLLKFAKQKRWQTCPNCKEMVELERGCYHITCRCRHEFCYLCLAKWQTCNCRAWDERHIINAPAAGQAPEVVQPAIVPHQAPNVAVRPAAVPPAPAPIVAPGALAPFQPFGPAPPPWASYMPPMYGYRPPGYPPYMQPPPPAFVPFTAPVHGYQPPPMFGYPAPVPFGGYGPAPIVHPPPTPICQVEGHEFERFYRSNGWNTRCQLCSREDRWVNCCEDCNLKVCWHCTKHRV